MEIKRDEAKKEAQVTWLVTVAASNAKALAKEEMARVRDALVAVEEVRCKAKVEAARLEVERTSLLLDIEASKDEVSSLQSQVGKDKEAMDEDY